MPGINSLLLFRCRRVMFVRHRPETMGNVKQGRDWISLVLHSRSISDLFLGWSICFASAEVARLFFGINVPDDVVGKTDNLVASSFSHLGKSFRFGLILKGIRREVDTYLSQKEWDLLRMKRTYQLGGHRLSPKCSLHLFRRAQSLRPCCFASRPIPQDMYGQCCIACSLRQWYRLWRGSLPADDLCLIQSTSCSRL